MNPRRRRFVHEYLKDLNGAQAAIRAGYSVVGSNATAARLLANASIKAAVDAAIAQRAVRVEAKGDDVVRELLRLASVDPLLAYDKHGALLPLHKMPEDVRRTISAIDVEEITDSEGNVLGHVKKVKFWDKNKAIELLGKHLRLFDVKQPGAGVQTSAGLSPKEALKILELARRGTTPAEDTEH